MATVGAENGDQEGWKGKRWTTMIRPVNATSQERERERERGGREREGRGRVKEVDVLAFTATFCYLAGSTKEKEKG